VKLINFDVGELLLRKFPMPEGKEAWQTGLIIEVGLSQITVKWLPQPKLNYVNSEELKYMKRTLISMLIGGSMMKSGEE